MGEGAGGSRRRVYVYNYDWFTLLYGRNQYNIAKQSIQLKNKTVKRNCVTLYNTVLYCTQWEDNSIICDNVDGHGGHCAMNEVCPRDKSCMVSLIQEFF